MPGGFVFLESVDPLCLTKDRGKSPEVRFVVLALLLKKVAKMPAEKLCCHKATELFLFGRMENRR
jgi:hypothetical protein